MQARSAMMAHIFKEIEVAILMVVESGYDSSSGKGATNSCSSMLDKSRTLRLEAIQRNLYRKSGIWIFGEINGNSVENLARVKPCSAFKNPVATKMSPSHKTYIVSTYIVTYWFLHFFWILLFSESRNLKKMWKWWNCGKQIHGILYKNWKPSKVVQVEDTVSFK